VPRIYCQLPDGLTASAAWSATTSHSQCRFQLYCITVLKRAVGLAPRTSVRTLVLYIRLLLGFRVTPITAKRTTTSTSPVSTLSYRSAETCPTTKLLIAFEPSQCLPSFAWFSLGSQASPTPHQRRGRFYPAPPAKTTHLKPQHQTHPRLTYPSLPTSRPRAALEPTSGTLDSSISTNSWTISLSPHTTAPGSRTSTSPFSNP
jgi:hypothetical protein